MVSSSKAQNLFCYGVKKLLRTAERYFACFGAGVSAGLLWVDNRRWVMSAWSTVPVIVGLAGALVVHDALALRCKQCAQVHAASPDERTVVSI